MEILLLEDNDIDAITFQRALNKTPVNSNLTVQENGEAGIDYLNDLEVLPDLIVLDLNMPSMGGLEFLQRIKRSEQWNHIPSLVLTTSDHHKDRLDSFRNGAAGYFVKPLSLKEYESILSTITQYWAQSRTPE